MTEQYGNDMRFERAVAAFMDENFYLPRFGARFERRDDRETQNHGVDLYLEINGQRVAFDEKAKEANYGGPVGFEMTYMKYGEERDGWFGGTWAEAEIVATVFPRSADRYPKSPGLITAADVLWTGKRRLREWAESFGATFGQLMEDARALRRDVDEGSMLFKRRYPHGRFWLTLSAEKDEAPVNLVIPRGELEKLSAQRFTVEAGAKWKSKK